MDYLLLLFKVPLLQAIGVVLLIALAERIGIPIISLLKSILKINGNGKTGEKTEERIDDLEKHAEVANHELGELSNDFKEVKADIKETTSYLRQHAEDDRKAQMDILLAINNLKKK